MRITVLFLLTAALSCCARPAIAQERNLDAVFAAPGLDTLSLDRIAMLPAASFAHDIQNEKLVEGMLARALVKSGHRWLSTSTTRVLLRNAAPDDSLLNAVRDEILKKGRLDSLSAVRVCEKLHVGAVLCIRIDRFEQVTLEPAQSGKPSTTVQARAALMGADGRLLWTISGSEVGEGPYQSPSSNPYRTPTGGVNLNPRSTSIGPPSYEEVLIKLFDRWGAQFPEQPEGAAG